MSRGKREIVKETNKIAVGKSGAVSSKEALYYHLISPELIRRLAERLTGGGKKYGPVQYRQGLGDVRYVADRFNHFIEHFINFLQDGNEKDDNLGAMLWGLNFLCEVERLHPDVLRDVIGACNLEGSAAKAYDDKYREVFK